MMECFAERYCELNPTDFKSTGMLKGILSGVSKCKAMNMEKMELFWRFFFT